MEKELKLGIMTNTELAEWFGMGSQSFRNTKGKKLAELAEYAEFEEIGSKIDIQIIKEYVYIKPRIRKQMAKAGKLTGQQKVWEAGVKWATGEANATTIKDQIARNREQIVAETGYAESTVLSYAYAAKKENYGKTQHSKYTVGNGTPGKKGISYYVYHLFYADGTNRPLTGAEEKYKYNFLHKYCGDRNLKIAEELDICQYQRAEFQIGEKEYIDRTVELQQQMTGIWSEAMRALELEWGCKIKRVTCLEDME